MDPRLFNARGAYVADEAVTGLEVVAGSHWYFYRREGLDGGRWGRFDDNLL